MWLMRIRKQKPTKPTSSAPNPKSPVDHRTRAGLGATAAAVGLLLVAANLDKGSAPTTAFESYRQARADVTALAGEYGETNDVPEAVSKEIKADLRGTVQMFQQNAISTVDNLVQRYGERGSVDASETARLSIGERTTDDGERTQTVSISPLDPEGHDRDLRVIYDQDNNVKKVEYWETKGGNVEGGTKGSKTIDTVTVERGNLEVFGSFDPDGNIDTQAGNLSRTVKFGSSFERDYWTEAGDGPDLKYAVDGMGLVDTFLEDVNTALQFAEPTS